MIYRHQGFLEDFVKAHAGGWCFTQEGLVELAPGASALMGSFRVSHGITSEQLKSTERPCFVAMQATPLIEQLRTEVRKAFVQLRKKVDRGHFYYIAHADPTCWLDTHRPASKRLSLETACYLELHFQATLLASPELLPEPYPRENVGVFSFEKGGPLPNWIGRFPEEFEQPLDFLQGYLDSQIAPLVREVLLGT